MPNKNDMRWRRTERNVMEAFADTLETTPLQKVSVTALAAKADINKATFYLHYHDVYDLADAYCARLAEKMAERMDYLPLFFSDPRGFASRFVDGLDAKRPTFALLERNGLVMPFMESFEKAMGQRLDHLIGREADADSQVATTFIVAGMLTAARRHADVGRDQLKRTLGNVLVAIGDYGKRQMGGLDD